MQTGKGVRDARAGRTATRPAKKRKVDGDRLLVTALTRGLEILACFRRDRDTLGTTEIARLTGLSQPTVWRLCYTLCHARFLERTEDEKLRLGPAATMLGHSAGAELDVSGIARPRMQELADRYQAAVGIALPDGLDMVLVERCQGDAPVVLNLTVGDRVPISSTSYGWAYIATLPSADRDALLARLRKSDPDQWTRVGARISRAVAAYRVKGFVVNCGVFNPNINGDGAAITCAGRIYALTVAGPASVLPKRLLETEVGPELSALGHWLSQQCEAQSGSSTSSR